MNIDTIYESNIINLLIIPFNKINKLDNYSWNNIKNIFIELYSVLKKSTNKDDLIKYYSLYIFFCIAYINYLKYSGNSDLDNPLILKLINQIKFDETIIENLISNSTNNYIEDILKLSNPFIINRLRNQKLNDNNTKKILIDEYINGSKQLDKLSEMSNNNYKKILNVCVYRFMMSKNISYNNYHNFYTKKIINSYNKENNNNIEAFLKQIPISKKLFSIGIKTNEEINLKISFSQIIDFFLNLYPNIFIVKSSTNNYVLSNSKYGGQIIILIDNKFKNLEFNHYQSNYNLINYNIIELSNYNFLKKTSSFIEIKYGAHLISNPTTLLDVIHLLTISIKILELYPSDIYETMYPLDYSQYYFQSFCNFLQFVKPIENNLISKFILDLTKYLYIYSYYDYYYYYSNDLMDAILKNYKFKHDIFNDFLSNLKNTLKLPTGLLPHPPFFDTEDDINSIIYYSFEIPNYFKLYDFINAIYFTENNKYYTEDISKQIPFTTIITNYVNNCKIIDHSKNNINSKQHSKIIQEKSESISLSDTSNSDITEDKADHDTNLLTSLPKSKILDNMTSYDKKLMSNDNSYIELNINNSTSYLLDTDIK